MKNQSNLWGNKTLLNCCQDGHSGSFFYLVYEIHWVFSSWQPEFSLELLNFPSTNLQNYQCSDIGTGFLAHSFLPRDLRAGSSHTSPEEDASGHHYHKRLLWVSSVTPDMGWRSRNGKSPKHVTAWVFQHLDDKVRYIWAMDVLSSIQAHKELRLTITVIHSPRAWAWYNCSCLYEIIYFSLVIKFFNAQVARFSANTGCNCNIACQKPKDKLSTVNETMMLKNWEQAFCQIKDTYRTNGNGMKK